MNMNPSIRTLIALPVVGVALFSATAAQAANVFATIDGNWDSNIWSTPLVTDPVTPGLRPDSDDTARLSGTRSVTINSNVGTVDILSLEGGGSPSLTLEAGAELEVLQSVGFNNAGGTRTLTMKAGSSLTVGTVFNLANATASPAGQTSTANINTGATLTTAGLRAGQTGTGLLNIAGGTVNVTGVSGQVAIVAGSTGSGTITISSGGEYISDINLTMASNASGTGTVNLQNGTMTIRGALLKGGGTANFNWTGGALSVDTTNLATINNTGTGIFAPGEVGSVGSFSLEAGATTAYTQGANASLALDFASDVSFDTISVGAGTALNMTLDGSISINLLAGFIPTLGETFDVITATSLIDNGFELSGAGAGYFTYEIVDVSGNDVLRLTAVPEPSVSLLLAAVGVYGVVFRRRR
jgi:hypothetical protein